MQHGLVDICIVGSDRTTVSGDVCNKIGTYLKALAAKDNMIPFYAALPKSTIDLALSDGIREIPIENRSETEVTHIQGLGENNEVINVRLCPETVKALNPAFDVTPRHLITGIITEDGVKRPNQLPLKLTGGDIIVLIIYPVCLYQNHWQHAVHAVAG